MLLRIKGTESEATAALHAHGIDAYKVTHGAPMAERRFPSTVVSVHGAYADIVAKWWEASPNVVHSASEETAPVGTLLWTSELLFARICGDAKGGQ